MLTIHDVISPTAIFWTKVIGYGVLLVGGAVVTVAGMRLYNQTRTFYNRNRWHW